jgi:hypothetical protein
MATYNELASLNEDAGWPAFADKALISVIKKATEIVDEASPSATRLSWARSALGSPRGSTNELIFYAVAKNSGLTTAQILGASDSAVQTNIDEAIDSLYP